MWQMHILADLHMERRMKFRYPMVFAMLVASVGMSWDEIIAIYPITVFHHNSKVVEYKQVGCK